MTADFKMEEGKLAEFALLRLKGIFTVSSLRHVKEKVQEFLKNKVHFICLDMSKCISIDSSALGLIKNLDRILEEKDGKLVLLGITEHVESTLTETNLLGTFTVYKNEEMFLEDFSI